MKRKNCVAAFLAVVFIFYSPISCLANQSPGQAAFAVDSGQGRSYSYATAAREVYNYAQVEMAANTIRIKRRAYQKHSNPDVVRLVRLGATAMEELGQWDAVDGGNSGYDMAFDAGALPNGAYTLTISSADTALHAYTLLALDFMKDANGCYIPRGQSLPKQHNFAMLNLLEEGAAPDDFAALQKLYGGSENEPLLAAIEKKSREVTDPYTDQQEKALAVYRWIVANVAYDFDFPRDGHEAWLEAHPEDAVRLDNPLNAFAKGYAMCYGYARLMVLMLGYAGIDSVYITGRLSTGNGRGLQAAAGEEELNHAWNAVKLGGQWYYLDACQDALMAYYRSEKQSPATGYLVKNKGPAYVHVFPSLSQISQSHIALRYGVENQGRKIEAMQVPDGLLNSASGLKRFYVDGVKSVSQWKTVGNSVYYFDSSGGAVVGWQFLDGYWRYFDENNVMATGTKQVRDGQAIRTYQFDSKGYVTGRGELLSFAGGVRYYQGNQMLTGWRNMNGSLRYFDPEGGAMFTGPGEKFNDYEGLWYTFDASGVATPKPTH